MIKSRFSIIINDYVFAILIIIFAYQINYYFGFIGINSGDSFQTFDTGNRILNGDLPFREYWSVDGGPGIDVMQALFFKILGVKWSSYVIHASILNSIFAFSVYLFARLNNLSKNKSLFLGILSGLIMYPAAGTPQVDHHAIIIGTISLIFFFLILIKKKFKFIIIFPTIFLFCFFIKQVPTAYYIIVIVLISLIYYFFLKENKIIINLLLGTLLSLIFLFLILKISNISFIAIYKQYIALILSNFNSRIVIQSDGRFLENIFKIKYIILLLIPFIFLTVKNFRNSDLKNKESYYLYTILFLGLLISSAIHESYTDNQSVTFGLIPIYSLLMLLLCKKNKNKILFYIFCILSTVALLRLINANEIYAILIFLLLIIYLFRTKLKISLKKTSSIIIIYTLLISLLYFENIIRNRYWFDIIDPNWDNAVQAKEIHPKFNGLVWLSSNKDTQKEIANIKLILSYLKSMDENYIIVTNYQIYNTILNRKNYSPVKYWWNNLTYPSKENKYRNEFDVFFKKKINENNIRKIIITNDIYDHFEINDFEWIKKCVTEKDENDTFIVYELLNKC